MAPVTDPVRIEPMTIDVPQPVLDDLRERLRRTRWPNEVPGATSSRALTWGKAQPAVDLLPRCSMPATG